MTRPRIAVFCGSAGGKDPAQIQRARDFGAAIAGRGWGVVYGGASVGLMGAVADGALAAGGEVIGVLPRSLARREIAHQGLTELLLVDSMHARKAEMAARAHAFVALPGGFGTLDEIFEALTWSQIGLHQKPCAFLSWDDFFAPLVAFVDHAAREGFVRPEHRALVWVDTSSASLLDRLAPVLAGARLTTHMPLPRNARAHLRKDRALARVIDQVGPFRLELGAGETHLGALVRAIVYQQLSGKAAATIHGRFRALFPPARHPSAAEILRVSEEQIRGCGLSRQKAASLRDLCEKVSSGEIPLDELSRESDEAIVAQLIHVRGIGVWSAQMFLLFHLGRPDVWPIDDLGIRKGVALVRGLPATPSPKATAELGERYRPFRSVAAWYFWRALELPPKPTVTAAKRTKKSRGEAALRARS